MKIFVHLVPRLRALPLSFFIGLWLATTISITFQSLLVGEFGSDGSVTPDGTGYIRLARELQSLGRGEIHSVGDYIRTPGYPLLILGAAILGGTDLKECEIPMGDWSNTNIQGRRLVKQVILIQQLMGLLIPVMLYLLVYGLTRWSLLAFLGSLVFAYDISSVSYQFVLLTEIASIAAIVVVLSLMVWVLRRPSSQRTIILGMAVSWAILLRPSFLLLAPMLLAILLVHGRVIRQDIRIPILLFVIAVASLPALWSMSNLATYGHFFYTKNQTATLDNFTSRYFVEMEVEDAQLRVFQKHVKIALERSPMFAMQNSMWQTAEELGERDIYEMYLLADRANWKTIASNMGPFLDGAWTRFVSMFAEGFRDVKNRYVQLRLEYLTDSQPGLFRDTKLLFGSASGVLLVLLCVATLFAVSDPVLREFLIFSVLFALTFMFLCGTFDENEHIRHGMAGRIVINLVLVMTGGLLVRRICSLFLSWRSGQKMRRPISRCDR